mgnify:CR=1 FL=1
MGAGGPIGLGQQWMSFIHIKDLVKMYIQGIEDSNFEGLYNAVAPNPIRNKDFSNQFAKNLKTLSLIPVPTPMLKLIFGEMSQVIYASQRVVPDRDALDHAVQFIDTLYMHLTLQQGVIGFPCQQVVLLEPQDEYSKKCQ